MSETVDGAQDLRDEAYVMAVIEGLGGAQAIVDGIREFSKIHSRLRSEWASLMENYPDKWIAMGKEGVLAVGDSMDSVLEEVESQGAIDARKSQLSSSIHPLPSSFCDHRQV